ncbi:MAG: RdgB/HAM1 family non-canonical purine NTP pyrophosphatase [Mogibacterium sp.]|nr:RdgB/HAM1 family non-canonical purine NTP pyrophosphatase [Mogibacterium sp.]
MKIAILASQNKNKIKEIRDILIKYGMELITRDDAGLPKDDIEETGSSFEENSLLKASAIMDMIQADAALAEKYADSPVIADDSGLMVDALGGAPGVYSARYAGEGCSYADNNDKLLSALETVPEEGRGAHFTTVITMLFPEGAELPPGAVKQGDRHMLVAVGECYGHIAKELKGEGGFGYDPLFVPKGYDKSFAELGTDFKNTISHRARALAELERILEQSDL